MKLLNPIVITNYNTNTVNYKRENGILACGFKCPWCRQEMVLVEMSKNFDGIKESVGQPDRYASNLFFRIEDLS
ncbi:hypothetical protein HZS_107 [Henneguya salminicola]|nr:hypothetical protein HZS_107 [Henneguya salminicola]